MKKKIDQCNVNIFSVEKYYLGASDTFIFGEYRDNNWLICSQTIEILLKNIYLLHKQIQNFFHQQLLRIVQKLY